MKLLNLFIVIVICLLVEFVICGDSLRNMLTIRTLLRLK
jgi:hypothetical protein